MIISTLLSIVSCTFYSGYVDGVYPNTHLVSNFEQTIQLSSWDNYIGNNILMQSFSNAYQNYYGYPSYFAHGSNTGDFEVDYGVTFWFDIDVRDELTGIVTTYEKYYVWTFEDDGNDTLTGDAGVDFSFSTFSQNPLNIGISSIWYVADDYEPLFLTSAMLDCRYSASSQIPNFELNVPVSELVNFGNSYCGFQFTLLTGALDYGVGYDTGYQNGLNDGQQQGYNQGYTAGSLTGYNNGYELGQVNGYNNGYQAGLHESGGDYSFRGLFRAIVDTPIWFLNSLFNFDFFGTGTTFITMITSLLTALVIVTLIKKVF